MEISIINSEVPQKDTDSIMGVTISANTKIGKSNLQQVDFFPDGSQIQIKVEELKTLLKDYFASQV